MPANYWAQTLSTSEMSTSSLGMWRGFCFTLFSDILWTNLLTNTRSRQIKIWLLPKTFPSYDAGKTDNTTLISIMTHNQDINSCNPTGFYWIPKYNLWKQLNLWGMEDFFLPQKVLWQNRKIRKKACMLILIVLNQIS